MSELVTIPASDLSLGPAMQKLNERQRAFVFACLQTGTNNNKLHAKMAGYGGDERTLQVTGHRLAHDPAVLAALHEEALKRMHSGVLVATSRLVELCTSAREEKDQLKAIAMVLNRAGIHEKTEHKLTVNHQVNELEMLKQIERMAEFVGIDPKKLIGNINIIDGEFKEVKPAAKEIDWDAPVGEAPNDDSNVS